MVCLDILKDQWTPAFSIEKILLSIYCLLQECNPGKLSSIFGQTMNAYSLGLKRIVIFVFEYSVMAVDRIFEYSFLHLQIIMMCTCYFNT